MRHDARGSHSRSKLTYDDYVSLPDDRNRYEIVDGELAVTPSPRVSHQRVSGNLYRPLHRYVQENASGLLLYAPVDVILDRSTVVVPDLVFVRTERTAIVNERGIDGAPDLVVEILSKGTARRDRGVKLQLYARFGVEHYWIVDPARRIVEVREHGARGYRLTGRHEGAATLRSTLFPGFELATVELWA
jgi:Uma2 family endonuclease